MLTYKYTMGIYANGVRIPDPSEWSYQVSDLDTEGSRDATGTLHRAWVAQKTNYEFSWNGLDWSMLQTILRAVDSPQFSLRAPNPKTYLSTRSGTYYVGDRTGKAHYYQTGRDGTALFDLKLKFIEF